MESEIIPSKALLSAARTNENMGHKYFNVNIHEDLVTDVTFIVEETHFRAHKVVLSCQSEVFAAMFTAPMNESMSNEVTINDMKKNVFEVFLNYLYTGEITGADLEKYGIELILCADKYFIKDLIFQCRTYFEVTLLATNAIERLLFANFLGYGSHKRRVIDFVASNFRKIVCTSGWGNLVEEFSLLKQVLLAIEPTTFSGTWLLTPDVWHGDVAKLPASNIYIRNFGQEVNVRVGLCCRRKTVYGSLLLVDDKIDRSVEMSFTFNLFTEDNDIIKTGHGNVWWEPNVDTDSDHDGCRPLQQLFECIYQNPYGAKYSRLMFTFTLSELVLPDITPKKLLKTPSPEQLSIEGARFPLAETPMKVVLDNESFLVPKTLLSLKSEYFQKLFQINMDEYNIEGIDKTTFIKCLDFVYSNQLTDNSEVDSLLLIGAQKLLLMSLVSHCEDIIAIKLTTESAIDMLVLAEQWGFKKLKLQVLHFIDTNHYEVVSSASWEILKDHNNLLVDILKKISGI